MAPVWARRPEELPVTASFPYRVEAQRSLSLVDVERRAMQEFVGPAPQDHRPWVKVLVGEVLERYPRNGWWSSGVKNCAGRRAEHTRHGCSRPEAAGL
jgi:hypothetical protein